MLIAVDTAGTKAPKDDELSEIAEFVAKTGTNS